MTAARTALVAALFLLGGPAVAQRTPSAPPPPRTFAPDRTTTGFFTGEGVVEPGVTCDGPAPDVALTCTGFLASALDRTRLEVVVRVPRSPGPHPLVVVMHGWGGGAGSWARYDDRLTGSGFTVLRYSARGFGRSWGQTNLGDVDVEGADLRSMIGQVVEDARFAADPDRVAVFGASYGGAHAWLAAASPSFPAREGGPTVTIRTVVPVAAWTDLLDALVPNGRPDRAHEVTGAQKLSYAQGMFFGGIRRRPEQPYPNYPEYLFRWNVAMTASELPYAANPLAAEFANGAQGYRSIYWQRPFWERVRAGGRLPILLVQGWTDDLFPSGEALRMYDALRAVDPAYPVALYLGDVGHPRAANKPGELEHVLDLVVAWLEGWLKPGATPPPLEVRAAITRPAAAAFTERDVVRVPAYDRLWTDVARVPFDGFRTITFDPLNLSGLRWDPLVMTACADLQPCPAAPPPDTVPGDVATYAVPAGRIAGGAPFLVAGEPRVTGWLVTFAHRVQLDARLFDVAPDETRTLLTRGTITFDTGTPGKPLGPRSFDLRTFGNLWEVAPDHTLLLELTNVDSPYLRPSLVPSVTVLGGVELAIPTRSPAAPAPPPALQAHAERDADVDDGPVHAEGPERAGELGRHLEVEPELAAERAEVGGDEGLDPEVGEREHGVVEADDEALVR